MKNIIIIAGTIILGIYIHGLIIGNDPNSIRNQSKIIMEQQIEQYKITP